MIMQVAQGLVFDLQLNMPVSQVIACPGKQQRIVAVYLRYGFHGRLHFNLFTTGRLQFVTAAQDLSAWKMYSGITLIIEYHAHAAFDPFVKRQRHCRGGSVTRVGKFIEY